MERMKAHAIEPGVTEGMMLRVRDGETVWEVSEDLATNLYLDELLDVDTTTTAPTVGQTLIFDDATGQWVPGTIPGTEAEPVKITTPTVASSRVFHRTGSPYAVELPLGANASFEGQFVIILNWLSTPPSTLTDLLALTDWTLLAYTGEWVPGNTPFVAVLGGDPRDAITAIAAGSGACEVTFLAVKDATEFRNLPLPTPGPVLVDNCSSAANWTSPGGIPPTAAGGEITGAAIHNSINPAPGLGGFLHKAAVLDRNVPLTFYTHPILVVEWKPPASATTAILTIQTRGAKYPFLDFPVYYPLSEPSEDLGDGYRRSVFRFISGNENRAEILALRFVAHYAEAGEVLKIRNIESRPSPNANHELDPSFGIGFPSAGVKAEAGDLLIAVGASLEVGRNLLDNMGGGVTVVANSNPGNPSLVTRTWAQPVVVAGRKYPVVYVQGELGTPGLAVAAIAIKGVVEAAPPPGGAAELDDLLDVDTTTDPPDDGQALVWDETAGQWVPGAAVGGLTAEEIRDLIGSTLVAGTNITVTVNDAGDTVTIASTGAGLTAEEVRDLIGATLVAGTNVSVTVNDAGDTVTVAATDTNTTDPEIVRDTIASALVGGTGITVTVDDAGNTITIAATGGGGATDPEIVRDTIAATLVAGTNVTITPNDGADTITISASGGGGGGASNLDGLTDVDTTTTAPTNGQVLVYDSATGLWKPGKGGPAVGSWENNLETVFVYPAHVENDLQSSPPVLPTSRPAVANFEVTVTSGMLVTNTGADLGHDTIMQIMLSARVVGAGSGNPTVEAAIWKAATGVETTSSTSQIGAPASGNRVYASIVSPLGIEVGDKVRIRMWSANGANYRVDWWAHRSLPTRIGKKQDAGRIALFRDVNPIGSIPGLTPTTVLTNAPTAWVAGADVSRSQWLDNGVLTNQNAVPGTTRTLIADPAGVTGILTGIDGIAGTSHTAIATSTVSAFIYGFNQPSQVRADRLFVPAPPT